MNYQEKERLTDGKFEKVSETNVITFVSLTFSNFRYLIWFFKVCFIRCVSSIVNIFRLIRTNVCYLKIG